MQELMELLERGKSPYHVVETVKGRYKAAGYQELAYTGKWSLEKGGKYLVCPYDTMLLAFTIPEKFSAESPVRIMMAHTDFPCFKIKPKASICKKDYLQLNIEPYGGMLKSTWFDRPLGLYGKAILRGKDACHPDTVWVESSHPVAVIPSLAPHFTKGAEQKKEYNVQQELVPIVAMLEEMLGKDDFLMKYLAEELNVSQEEILDYDLYLANMDRPEYVGLNRKWISAPRIDNLASVAAITQAMTTEQKTQALVIAGLFDHEEIGSRSGKGADSVLFSNILEKIGAAFSMDAVTVRDMTAGGFLLSVDGAHALHPNYPECSDVTNDVLPGKGPVIKTSASQRYLSDGRASAVVEELCRQSGIACQRQVNRSGMPGGQTLGPIAVSYLPMLGADVGIPMLAMHSARELAYVSDYEHLANFLAVYIKTC